MDHRNVEVVVCSCPAQYGHMPCTCSIRIPRDPNEMPTMLPNAEALMAIGVCPWCGNIEEECECF